MAVQSKQARSINIRSIALPAEHGAWGFLLEPILVGLILAPAWAGLVLSGALFAAFLTHQPLKLALKDRIKGRFTPRTQVAQRFALAYGATAAAFFIIVLLTSSLDFLIPLILAAPLVIVQNMLDVRNQSRSLMAELTGSLALGAIAPAIVLLDDWNLTAALLIWLLLAVRTITSILFVRAKLRLEREKPFSMLGVIAIHIMAVVALIALTFIEPRLLPAAIGAVLLTLRTYHGLRKAEYIKAKVVGFREMAIGILFAICVVLVFLL